MALVMHTALVVKWTQHGKRGGQAPASSKAARPASRAADAAGSRKDPSTARERDQLCDEAGPKLTVGVQMSTGGSATANRSLEFGIQFKTDQQN